MCKVYNSIGCLTVIKNHLREQGINEFKSLNEVRNFLKNYSSILQETVFNHTSLIEQEKSTLNDEIFQLKNSIELRKTEVENQIQSELENLKYRLENLPLTHSNLAKEFTTDFKKIVLTIKIWIDEFMLDYKPKYSVRKSMKMLSEKANRYEYIDSYFIDAVNKSALVQLLELKRKKSIIDEINNTIYGALGEQKVVKELENLSDEFILINDFNCSFNPPIYYSAENNYIKSVQMDHVLISSSGIFLIETKNWSEYSLNNLSMYSPVQQIKRASFALNKVLNEKSGKSILKLKRHHWGDRKVPIKKLIVLINQKPREEFQYVKILTLNELLSYINYFEPTLSSNETQNVANYLLKFQAK
jgi:hypothetical protein